MWLCFHSNTSLRWMRWNYVTRIFFRCNHYKCESKVFLNSWYTFICSGWLWNLKDLQAFRAPSKISKHQNPLFFKGNELIVFTVKAILIWAHSYAEPEVCRFKQAEWNFYSFVTKLEAAFRQDQKVRSISVELSRLSKAFTSQV